MEHHGREEEAGAQSADIKVRKKKLRLRPEAVVVLLLLCTITVCCAAAIVVYQTPEDPLCERIEEDPCFVDDVFHIYNKKDYLRFMGYVNRARKKSEAGREDAVLSVDAALMADIDLAEGEGYPSGSSPYIRSPILSYAGTFEGNGHTIDWISEGSYGMFVRLEREAEVKNLTIRAEHIAYLTEEEDEALTDSGYGLGMICMANYGRIADCRVQGKIEGERSYVGGIAGINYGTIAGCVNLASVDALGTGEYGAGGIAGKNADTWTENDGDSDVKAVIQGCRNEGAVTGDWLAGGICAVNEGTDTEIVRCGNEGEISVRCQKVQPDLESELDENQREQWEVSMAGGIAGEMDSGLFLECYNTGRVSIQEEGNGATYGIAGGAWGNSEVRNCVSLSGAVTGRMRHENIMELSPREMEQWQADSEALSYVHNNWQFDLEEAKEKLGIIPLGVSQSVLTQEKEDVFLCSEFMIRAPKGFVIRTVSDYALCMEAGPGSDLAQRGDEAGDWQVWVLRLPDQQMAAMNRFLQTCGKLESIYAGAGVFDDADSSLPGALWLASLDDEQREADISGIWGCIEEPDWLHPLYFINGWDHHTWAVDGRYSFNLYKEELNAKFYVYVDPQDPESPRMDNIISLPVKSTPETGNEVRYLLLLTNGYSNYRPDLDFAREVLAGFYYLPYKRKVREGETLWSLAESYTGEAGRYPELAVYNGLEDEDRILEGQWLAVPEEWLAEEAP